MRPSSIRTGVLVKRRRDARECVCTEKGYIRTVRRQVVICKPGREASGVTKSDMLISDF